MNNMDFLVILYEDGCINIHFDIREAYLKELIYGEEKKKELYIIFRDGQLLRIPWDEIKSIHTDSFPIAGLKEAIEHAEHKQ